LSTQPANTVSSPYTVVLGGGFDLGKDFIKGDDPLGLLYEALNGKYVGLDLNACGGNIPGINIGYTYDRPDRDKIVSIISCRIALLSSGRPLFATVAPLRP
jgi:hypothetical protein